MPAAGAGDDDADDPDYDERLVVPLWAWPAAVLLAVVLAAPVHGGSGGARAVVPYLVTLSLAVAVLVHASRGRVRVADGVLHVPGARVPLEVLGAVGALDPEQARRLRGPAADVRAHVASRPWLRRAVQVQLEDPDDDTPYWLVSTARPEQLVAALDSARRAGGA
jgi:hypothetical protein